MKYNTTLLIIINHHHYYYYKIVTKGSLKMKTKNTTTRGRKSIPYLLAHKFGDELLDGTRHLLFIKHSATVHALQGGGQLGGHVEKLLHGLDALQKEQGGQNAAGFRRQWAQL
jgi:hypothetical protein